MTIDEAIKILEDYPPGASPDDSIEFNQAILLGIEALKSVRTGREVGLHYEANYLSGETAE